jgi:cytochrome c-type biogenesis protein CcmF
MIPEIGQFALALALMIAFMQAALPLWGAQRGDAALIAFARPAAYAQFACVVLAFAALMASFVGNDFSVINVASNSNSRLPLAYRIAATWGSHEGSLLLWTLMLGGWTCAVALLSGRLPATVTARVIGVLGVVSVGFLLFMLFTSNPFDRTLPPPDGRDLNPLLQDPGMVAHPPLLYMGYVGFSVAFAFAVAALLSGRLDPAWARFARPWTVAAWSFLSVGIALGSFWAYYELGWGGWWFWDPVENASLMPWLAGTALIHSLAVTEKRRVFKSWTVVLAIATFTLSLLGTFLVRSGVLTSVHAFATDPTRGVFILALLLVVSGGAFALYAWRANSLGAGGTFSAWSRETLLLANNVLLVTVTAAVIIGTLYPLAIDALGLGKISVGPPYFETVFLPLLAPAILLMGLAPVVAWKRAEGKPVARQAITAAVAAAVLTAVTLLAAGGGSVLTAIGLLLGYWASSAVVAGVVLRITRAPAPDLAGKLRSLSASYCGMQLAHLGIAVFVLAVTMVKSYSTELDVELRAGQSATLSGRTFTLEGFSEKAGPNYAALVAHFAVTEPNGRVRAMTAEKRRYAASEQTMTEAAINRGFTRDLYISLGDALGTDANAAWSVRVQVKPFINWIWLAVLMMAGGGLLAITDRRYRIAPRAARILPA